METKITKMNRTDTFESPTEFLAYLETPPNKRAKIESGDFSTSWYGNVTTKGAIELARTGWDKAPKLSEGESFQKLRDYSQGQAELTVASVSGAFLDIGAFVSGEPECFQEFTQVETPRGIVLGVNIGANCTETTKSMTNKGVATLAIADELERNGFSVSLVAFWHTGKDKTGTMVLPIKQAGERVDENQIAFWSCHPAALRHLGFRWQDRLCDTWLANTHGTSNRGRSHTPNSIEGVDHIFTSGVSLSNEEATLSYYKQEMAKIEAKVSKQD